MGYRGTTGEPRQRLGPVAISQGMMKRCRQRRDGDDDHEIKQQFQRGRSPVAFVGVACGQDQTWCHCRQSIHGMRATTIGTVFGMQFLPFVARRFGRMRDLN